MTEDEYRNLKVGDEIRALRSNICNSAGQVFKILLVRDGHPKFKCNMANSERETELHGMPPSHIKDYDVVDKRGPW